MTGRPCSSAEAKRFLDEIAQWCAKTETNETYLGHAAFRHPGFVALLRKRRSLTVEKRDVVRDLMARNPDGIERGRLPSMFLKTPAQSVGSEAYEPTGAYKCGVCGHRVDVACAYGGCPLQSAA